MQKIATFISSNTEHSILRTVSSSSWFNRTSAMNKDSAFVSWAIQCDIQRGFIDISDTLQGYASVGDSNMPWFSWINGIVSLGDGGEATLSFESIIYDGPGWDLLFLRILSVILI